MDETPIKRTMPHSLEAEQSVIGAMLMDREAIMEAGEVLVREDFYYSQYGLLYEAIQELYAEGKPADLVTLQERLREKNAPPELCSLEYAGELMAGVPTSANIRYYADIVKEKAILRSLIRVNEKIADDCYQSVRPLPEILEQTEKEIFHLIQSQASGDFVPVRQIVVNALAKIELASRTRGGVTGIPTGFADIDYKLSGMQPSDLILVAARPSMGKTAFVLNIAHYMTVRQKRSAVIFSLEMSKDQLINRMLAMESKVDAQQLRNGSLSDADWEKLVEGANAVGSSGLIIDDTPGISVSEMRSKCRKYKLEYNIEAIFIDYIQMMTLTGRKVESKQQEIAEISRSLKALARELNVPVIALSQLSRAVEKRDNHRPILSDLRESGAIEQDADVVMFIYRDDYYNKDSEKKGIAEISIAKQRNGPIGTVDLVWLPQYTRFHDLER